MSGACTLYGGAHARALMYAFPADSSISTQPDNLIWLVPVARDKNMCTNTASPTVRALSIRDHINVYKIKILIIQTTSRFLLSHSTATRLHLVWYPLPRHRLRRCRRMPSKLPTAGIRGARVAQRVHTAHRQQASRDNKQQPRSKCTHGKWPVTQATLLQSSPRVGVGLPK